MSKKILIDSTEFLMGAEENEGGHPLDKEYPKRKIYLEPFWIENTTVTNTQFKEFVEDTGYITEAEKLGGSFVFSLLLKKDSLSYEKMYKTPWWCYVEQSYWKQPEGKNSTIDTRMNHPVVHVSRNDAIAYCDWAGKRLPTEAEWECAARGGVSSSFPWGDDLTQCDQFHANTWQGEFPIQNTKEDGYLGTAPVKSFAPNKIGLYEVIGNVWEWCLNPGGIDLEEFNDKKSLEFYEKYWKSSYGRFATKGGSFLCHSSYCNRYRLGARNQNFSDTTSSNLGFRCVSL